MATTTTAPRGKNRPLAGAVISIPIDEVAPHPLNPRGDWKNAGLEGLARSLQEHDLLQPIVVRRFADPDSEKSYQLIFGERRFRAAQLAGWEVIPARVVNVSDLKALQMMGAENLERRDWNPMELAHYLKVLNRPLEDGGAGMTQAKIGALFGKSSEWAANLARLVNLPDDFQALVAAGELDPTAARCLLPYVDQPEVLEAIRRDLEANPDDWRRRDDVDRNAKFLAEQLNRGLTPPTAAAPLTPEPPARAGAEGALSRRIDAAGQAPPAAAARGGSEPAPGPTLRQHEARALLAPYAENAADLKLIRAVAHDLLTALRREPVEG